MLNLNDFNKITDEFNLHYWELKHLFRPLGQEQSFNVTIEARMFDKYKFDVKVYLKDSIEAFNTTPIKNLYEAPEVAYTMIMKYVFQQQTSN